MRDRTVSISSAGKTFSFTGWKVGWVTASANWSRQSAPQAVPDYVSAGPSSTPSPKPHPPRHVLRRFRDDLRVKRDLLAAGLTDAGFDVFRPAGTYFITTTSPTCPGHRRLDLLPHPPEKCGVVAVPNSVFYDHPPPAAPKSASPSANAKTS